MTRKQPPTQSRQAAAPAGIAPPGANGWSAGGFVDSREACRLLQVKAATLYTYVSRGLLHPVAQPGRKARLYLREEVEGLRARSQARMGHGAVAATALRWGQPVIDTAITEITPAGPRYRGHLAADLAGFPGAFENVAELLWTGVLPDGASVWPAEPLAEPARRALRGLWPRAGEPADMARLFQAAALALGGGSVDEEVRSGSHIAGARRLLFAFATCCGALSPQRRLRAPSGRKPLAVHVAEALGMPAGESLARAIDTMLILGADHELSPPTFSARVAASVGAELHACVGAALATLSGTGLAGGCDRIEQTLASIQTRAQLDAWIARVVQQRARSLPFGIESYPQGDPRAAQLLRMARSQSRRPRRADTLLRFVDGVQARVGVPPRLELGLVAACAAWDLPAGSAAALWGMGRTAGWVAHALEQRMNGFFLRPRGLFQAAPGEGAMLESKA
ncbi:2-methylcitrate synthase 1 [Pigmentiphaga humi]|uniref:citrate synthase (unknown stereospecificity) n=1 Tax=Pigmentiphaga humi TaxID=2478468 RepID=A0A3P4B1X9_9BURK|nr:citrate synthase [Pigmentiphaga humi]VCU70283.1 2-methylcitrate synthase 1 [Pigmentiphaga humi]